MEEKKTEMQKKKNAKKANLLDHNSIKNILDESVSEIVKSKGYSQKKIVKSKGYIEDVRMSNTRLFLGVIIIVIALLAQFYNKKFPENMSFLIVCIILYVVFNGLLQLIIYTKEKNTILFTYPPAFFAFLRKFMNLYDAYGAKWSKSEVHKLAETLKGSFDTTGLVVSSKLPGFSDMYNLHIASADPKSISANPPVEFNKSVTQWFTTDGTLVEGLFWKDVERLINDYAKGAKKRK